MTQPHHHRTTREHASTAAAAAAVARVNARAHQHTADPELDQNPPAYITPDIARTIRQHLEKTRHGHH
jgi:hypothetical protein